MPVRLRAEERSADVLVRKGRGDYRIYPISDAALRWLKECEPRGAWSVISGRDTMTASRAETSRLLNKIRSNDFRVRGESIE